MGHYVENSKTDLTNDNSQSKSLTLVFLITLAFITLNINPGIGTFEYFPLIALILVIASGTTSFPHICIGLLVMSLSFFSGLIPENTETINLSNNIKIIVAILFFLFGGSAVFKNEISLTKSCEYILYIHLLYSFLFIISPGSITFFQELAGLRGIMYEGKASFFSSEPSYAAINLMGVYILSLTNNEKHLKYIIKILITITCLILTKSITGLAFVFGLLIISLNIKYNIILAAGIIIAATITTTNDESPISRIAGIIEFLPNDIDSTSIKEALNIIEPSGMWRYLVNSSNLNIGLSSLLGTSSFSIVPNINYIDDNIKFLILNNPTYDLLPDVLSQSIIPSFSIFLGITGFTLITLSLGLSIFGFLRSKTSVPKKNKLSIIYLLIGGFWQSSLTAPLWWMILSLGILYFSQRFDLSQSINQKGKI